MKDDKKETKVAVIVPINQDMMGKINSGKYKNKDNYPIKPQKPFLPKLDSENPEKIREYTVKVSDFAKAMENYNKAMDNYYEVKKAFDAKQKELNDLFEKDLQLEFNITPSVHSIIYSKAYEEGHSGGFSEIYHWYEELAGFVYDIIKAIKKDEPKEGGLGV